MGHDALICEFIKIKIEDKWIYQIQRHPFVFFLATQSHGTHFVMKFVILDLTTTATFLLEYLPVSSLKSA